MSAIGSRSWATSFIARRTLLSLLALDILLFVVANVTAKNAQHPGTASNVFWVAFLIGAVLLIVLALVALVGRLQAGRTRS
jgi:hypothetical protein